MRDFADRVSSTIKLKDISMKLEDIKPSSGKSIVALDDKNGLSILLHKAADAPKPLVAIYVVTTISKKPLALQNYLFQAVVPKVRLKHAIFLALQFFPGLQTEAFATISHWIARVQPFPTPSGNHANSFNSKRW